MKINYYLKKFYQTNNFENTDFESLNIDQGLIERILKYASIKHILFKNFNDDQKILKFYLK